MRISDWSQTCALPIYPFACPIHADLTGLPPVLLVVPECDLLAEQSLVMEARLEAAGVATTTTIYPGATHSFLEAMSVAQVARDAIRDGAAFVADRLGCSGRDKACVPPHREPAL